MPKIDVETTKFILQRNLPDIRMVNEVMQEIEMELRAEEEEKANKPPAQKKQTVMLVSADSIRAWDAERGGDLVGWVVEIPEDDAPCHAIPRLMAAACEFNTTPKGRRMPLETIGETCEVCPPRILKEVQLWVKTKTPVLVLPVENRIPFDEIPTYENK